MRALVVAVGIFTIGVLAPGLRGEAPLGQRVAGLAAKSASASSLASGRAPSARCPGARKGLRFYRAATWRWQDQRDVARTRSGQAIRSRSCAYVRWAARLWQTRAREARAAFVAWLDRMIGPGGKWACIHHEEGSWTDDGAPHWGGLQMDLDFQETYGGEFIRRWGTANHWPPWAQVIAAERGFHGYGGHRGRGFHPWPNTARACGLL